jgi:hypothetical protein
MGSATDWAEDEFGEARFGDVRRARRLVALAAEVAQQPAGTVTGACRSSASKEGAFRWLESRAVSLEPLAVAVQRSALRRCAALKRVVVPIDATSLTLTDKSRRKGFGAVGSWRQGSQGVHVMTALAIDQEGTALGVAAQKFWVRKRRSKASKKAASPANCETRFWLDTLVETHAAFREQAPDTEAWFQLDRGADCWPVLETATQHRMLLTVRAAHDRRVDTSAKRLWDEVEASHVRMAFKIAVSQRAKVRKRRRINGRRIEWTVPRKARVAELAVRAVQVPLSFRNGETILFNAVLVRERHRRGDDRIEWMLLTTHPIRTRADIRAVVDGYALRWKIEEFHRTWKRGRCRVEDTQLRSEQAVLKWATILASVATRAMRLTYQARETPDAPATEELTRFELDAIIALRQPKGIKLGHEPTLGQAVRWIADLGGYVGPWNGPPGPKVIGRGLDDVLAAAKAMEAAQKMR